jgi:hypothetical protein
LTFFIQQKSLEIHLDVLSFLFYDLVYHFFFVYLMGHYFIVFCI